MKRAIVITPEGHVIPAIITGLPDHTGAAPEYQQLQELVGGFIESPAQPHPNLTIFVNEDGKRLDLPPNRLATAIFGGGLQPSDYLAGPVVVMGGVDAEGETRGLTLEQTDIFLSPRGEKILNQLVTRADA